jgi:hypothetical protein
MRGQKPAHTKPPMHYLNTEKHFEELNRRDSMKCVQVGFRCSSDMAQVKIKAG